MLIEPSRSWRSIDLGPILSGQWSPPQPAVGARRDGIGLFYPRKMHSVASESEAAKPGLQSLPHITNCNKAIRCSTSTSRTTKTESSADYSPSTHRMNGYANDSTTSGPHNR